MLTLALGKQHLLWQVYQCTFWYLRQNCNKHKSLQQSVFCPRTICFMCEFLDPDFNQRCRDCDSCRTRTKYGPTVTKSPSSPTLVCPTQRWGLPSRYPDPCLPNFIALRRTWYVNHKKRVTTTEELTTLQFVMSFYTYVLSVYKSLGKVERVLCDWSLTFS